MNSSLKPLNELMKSGDTSNLEINAYTSNNLGNFTLITKIPLFDFYRMSDVANERSANGEPVAQRKLDLKHATSLARYILKAVLTAVINEDKSIDSEIINTADELRNIVGAQPYTALQPLVANLRTAGESGCNLKGSHIYTQTGEPVGLKVWLSQQDILYVVDGQHRRKAIQMVIDFLDEIKSDHKYPTKKSSIFPHNRNDRMVPQEELNVWYECDNIIRQNFTVSVEIHLGLNIEQERQLFHDLNNLGKKVEKSLALEFDSSNPINAFIKTNLAQAGINICDADKIDWDKDNGSLTRKDIVGVNAILLLNKNNINSATPTIVEPRIDTANEFWHAVTMIPHFGEEFAKKNTVAAQPVVLKALAKLTYDFAFGKNKNEENLEKLLSSIPHIDFSHNNPVWRYYQLTEEECIQYGLTEIDEYLPDNETGNRDPGSFDGKWMRFGSKHNDIYPIIGDMIRWTLKLPNRHNKQLKLEI